MEKDEHWIPKTRSQLGIPADTADGPDYFSDTPIVTAVQLVIQQIFGFPAYLLVNTSGQESFPANTSHFNPFAMALFKKSQRTAVVLSDLGILIMVYVVYLGSRAFGVGVVLRLYGIPCLIVCHWVTMIVFLHHTDPQLPHYRKSSWTFQRGALATMDRDFLGWQGHFFLHDIAHFHTIHHLFPNMPFYHTEEATKILKDILPKEYRSSSKPVFRCLWENFKACRFVEDDGDILFYKNKRERNQTGR